MTAHEKRINRMDLDAYDNQDLILNSMINGLTPYTKRSMSASRYGSKTISPTKSLGNLKTNVS